MNTKEYNHFHYIKNKEKILLRHKIWNEKNNEKNSSYHSVWQKNNKDKLKLHILKSRYGISKVEYDNLISNQKDGCIICHKKVKLVLDHNHKTGKVRGLLCNKCNLGLGNFQDSIKLLENAKKYLTT